MSNTDQFLVSEAHLEINKAREQKALAIKDLGSPINLTGKVLSSLVQDRYVWVGDNVNTVKKIDLETGSPTKIFRGHKGPVSSIALFQNKDGSSILITGSWDMSIKLWNAETKELISSTPNAHSDFVKSLLVLPTLQLLVSGGSDKIVRFWDLSSLKSGFPLKSCGSISAHTRPIECLDGRATSATTADLCTADTMGVIKYWKIEKQDSEGRWKSTLQVEYKHHRTGINALFLDKDRLWTVSTDETAQIMSILNPNDKTTSITHPVGVRAMLPLAITPLEEPYLITGAGDIIRVYDVAPVDNKGEPELINEIDAHWHDITDLHLWVRRTRTEGEKLLVEPWIVSVSLDGTIRKWQLSELLTPKPPANTKPVPPSGDAGLTTSGLTEEEERELNELMDED